MSYLTFGLVLVIGCHFSLGDELDCYHCTKQLDNSGAKEVITYLEYNTGNKVDKCATKKCDGSKEQCFNLTTAQDDNEEKIKSVYMSCVVVSDSDTATAKGVVCAEVATVNIAKCKSDFTFRTCKVDMCNASSGKGLQPLLLLIVAAATMAVLAQ